jgi:hypothetical protein
MELTMTNANTAQAVMQSNGFEIRVVVSASGLELTARLCDVMEPSDTSLDAEDAVSTDLSAQVQVTRQNSFSGHGRETALAAGDSYVWDASHGDVDNHGGWNVADGGEPVGAEPVADDDGYGYGYDEMTASRSYGQSNSASMVPAGAS